MDSLRELFKIGFGPSSSHTMGPERIASKVKDAYPDATRIKVELYGSLSFTGKGHLTDYIVKKTLGDICEVEFMDTELEYHSNAMILYVYEGDSLLDKVIAYSTGGGSVHFEDSKWTADVTTFDVYPEKNLKEVREYLMKHLCSIYDYVLSHEGEGFEAYLHKVLHAMYESIESGLAKTGKLPGILQLDRVASDMISQAVNANNESEKERMLVSGYAYAVAEENASGNRIVTAPTCGSSGVLPAVLYFCSRYKHVSDDELVRALAVAGIIGNVVKHNATISGADGGCQAEIGTACAMTAAAYAYILGLSNELIAYAAEMGLEHNLGLTCDPVGGYVQIPCIERNGFAALRAMDAAIYAKQLGYMRKNRVPFDSVVQVMKETGHDLSSLYKETSLGGLAKNVQLEK